MSDNGNDDLVRCREQLAEAIAINSDLRQQYELLAERMAALNQFVMNRLGATSVEHVLIKGFETLSAQFESLESLRDLTPKRTRLSDEALIKLGEMRMSLARPDWADGRPFTERELTELSPDEPITIKGDAL